jgi:hypothetical protein
MSVSIKTRKKWTAKKGSAKKLDNLLASTLNSPLFRPYLDIDGLLHLPDPFGHEETIYGHVPDTDTFYWHVLNEQGQLTGKAYEVTDRALIPHIRADFRWTQKQAA